MIELITGAGIAAASYTVGHLFGRRTRKAAGPPPEICQCGHGSAYHDRAGCHHEVHGQILRYNQWADPIKWEIAECPCVRYVGPLSSYVPELDGDLRALDSKET